jgi:hypothetical protein
MSPPCPRLRRLALLLGPLFLLLPVGTLAGEGWSVRFEEAIYDVSWGVVPAGTGMFRAAPQDDGGLVLRAQICSTGLVDAIHPVRDQLYSRVAVEDGLRPQYHRVTQIEGGDREDTIVQFGRDGQAYYRKGDKTKVLEVPAGIQGSLTAIYAIRRMDLEVGETYRLPLLDGDDLETLVVPVTGRTEVNGKKVLEVYPYTVEAGKREQEDEWELLLTDDDRRIPVRMKLALSFGKLRLKLTELRTEPRGTDPRVMFCDPEVRMPR